MALALTVFLPPIFSAATFFIAFSHISHTSTDANSWAQGEHESSPEPLNVLAHFEEDWVSLEGIKFLIPNP
jgi:hypothetical protein